MYDQPPPYKLNENPPSYVVVNIPLEAINNTTDETTDDSVSNTVSKEEFISFWCVIISFIILSSLWTSWKYTGSSVFLSFAVLYTLLFGVYLLFLAFCLMSCTFFIGL